MIEVENLTKHYGQHVALDGITFSVGHGEVVGFLGPNGAGKSTTMRILTTFLAATSGSVYIGGNCVFEQPNLVRSRIGYMPENNPLPIDLRVIDYLAFRAQLKHLSKNIAKKRIDEVVEQCGISNIANRFIVQLSRGYRQRVGMADALLANPELIILDEPTSGLDPKQLIEIRKIITNIGKEKTILLSTHIIQEVEAICNRIIIINKGEIIANKKIEEFDKNIEKFFLQLIK